MTMELSRRSFLRGVVSVTATFTPAVRALDALAAVPILYGDGLHDDVEALEALFAGQPVICEKFAMRDQHSLLIKGGRFLLSRTLHVKAKSHAQIIRSSFEAGKEFEGNALLKFYARHDETFWSNCYFESPETSLIFTSMTVRKSDAALNPDYGPVIHLDRATLVEEDKP